MYPNMNRVMQQMHYGVGPNDVLQTGSTTKPASSGSYWKGQDGNVWVAGSQGTNNAGAWDNNTQNYWNSKGFTLQDDPNSRGYQADSTPIGGSSRTSGSSTSTFDPTSLWEAQDALSQANNYLGMLDPQRNQFLTNLSSQYAKYREELAGQRGEYQGQYDKSKTTANQNRVTANNTIDGKVRQRANSLQRLMGQYGAGDSEAAQMYAPYAAARTGSQLRNQVNQQYGQTLQGLDDSWNQYTRGYDKSIGDLATEETNTKNSKLQEFLQKQYDLEDQKRKAEAAVGYAQGGNTEQARASREAALPRMYQLLQEIQALGAQQFTPTQQNINYESKPVEQFMVQDPGDVQGVDPTMADTTSPYYQWLLKQQDDDNNFFGY